MNGTRSNRKRKVDSVVKESNFTDDDHENESSESEPSDMSTSDMEREEDKDDFWPSKKSSAVKSGRPKKNSTNNGGIKKEEETPFISEYERIRLQNIAERNELLRSMGIMVNYNETPSPSVKKAKEIRRIKKEKENVPMRMILRSKGKVKDDKFVDESKTATVEPEVDTRNLGREKWVEDELEGRENFLEELKGKINEINYNSDSLDLSACSQECFRDVMLSLIIKDTPKVVSSRVQSLCVHPNSVKKIVLVGSSSGSLGIWDVDGSEESHFELYPSHGPINCITVDDYNPNQFLLTSHEGTFTLCDIETKNFDNIYATSFGETIKHLTWHNQLDENSFLLAHGNGSVLVIDKRMKEVSTRIECFKRSARTVQHHPNNNYFLVSSGVIGSGGGIFDIRSKKEVSHLEHPKGLTSAFFSPSGSKILSTCNDDTIKIWNSENLKQVKSEVCVPHNNHTGRWLSVFKAQWYPGRDDIFYVGSLLHPRRFQMYTNKGKLLTELRSDEIMLTIQPVIAVHNTLPFIVGGNSSGRLHAFVPPN